MNWIVLTCLSALFLGIYDLLKKISLRDNAVPPVLFFSVGTGACIWFPVWVMSVYNPEALRLLGIELENLSYVGHLHLLAKSSIVGFSWIFAYVAVKHLPVSISGPIRASAPLWTILMAVIIMSERPNPWQWSGIITILTSFYLFSLVGKLEGIHFLRDKWVGFMVIATIAGACSALYDKWLLQTQNYGVATVQCWFSFYLVVVLSPIYIHWKLRRDKDSTFRWRWSIPGIGVMLILADALYFMAVKDQDSLISVITPIRRSSIFISFIGAVILFKELHFKRKFLLIILLILGLILLKLGT